MVDINGELSVVIPAYNEGACIYNNILTTIKILERFVQMFEIIIVNDGSKDNTKEEIERVMRCDDRIHIVSSEHNHGKGDRKSVV